jgi:hypothetical protein
MTPDNPQFCNQCIALPTKAARGDEYSILKRRYEYMQWLRSQYSRDGFCPPNALCKPLIDAHTEFLDLNASRVEGVDYE